MAKGASAPRISQIVPLTSQALRTIARRYQQGGLESALFEKQRPGAVAVLDDAQKQRIIAVVCSNPPEGRARWTVRLVAQEAVKRRLVPREGRKTVRVLLLDHDLKPWGGKMWCVAELNEEYISKMEDVLETYEKPYDPAKPVVCLDEKPVTLHADVRPTSPAKPGREARRDNEYERRGTVRRRIAKSAPFTAYGDLYQRSTAILNARIAQLTSSVDGEPLHTRVLWHAWWSGAVADKYPAAGDYCVACASVTIGLVYPNDGGTRPKGNDAPEASELMASGGALAALLSSQNDPVQCFDEAYIDFDFNDPSVASADITLSYGEYMSPIQGPNFEPFVQRAESGQVPLSIVQRPASSDETRFKDRPT